MKSIKMFGLAALVALMAMASVGAGSAMAEKTELCSGDPGTGTTATCPEGKAVTTIHETSVGKAKLLASPQVECNVLFASTKVGAAGAPQVIEGHFTYTNCGCTVSEVAGTTASIAVLRTGHETASVEGEAEVKVTCFGISCTYNGEGLVGTAKGPLLSTEPNGEINLSEQVVSGKGTFCPASGKLDIKTTPLTKTYIGKGGALLYCVRVEHPENGEYEDPECLHAAANKPYVLMTGPAGQEGAVCLHMGPTGGLWKGEVSLAECKEDNKTSSNTSEFEQGTITTIY